MALSPDLGLDNNCVDGLESVDGAGYVSFSASSQFFDREKEQFVWYYALPEGGLYAAHIAKDGDESNGERVYAGIKEWVVQSGCFKLDERPGHYDVFHITMPKKAAELIG